MRVFDSAIKNYLYLGYRLINPVIDPIRLYTGVLGYSWYLRDFFRYKRLAPQEKISITNLFPVLDEKVSITPFDTHYFYQEIWAIRHIFKNKPKRHIDIASKYQFAGFISSITPCVFVDIRPIKSELKNLSVVKGDVLHLPYKDNSVSSVSTLHVIEHIGLGRYGDRIDPSGTKKACLELSRILRPGGRLYVSIPIGKDKLCFNAHRIHSPHVFRSYFPTLKLIEFSVVDDLGRYYEDVDYRKFSKLNYGCGMFLFTKLK